MTSRSLVLVLLAALGAGLCPQAAAQPPVKRLALVFDDGPVPADAEPLLATLARENVTATFSLVGDRVEEHPALAQKIAAAGHEVANHSQKHAHPRDLDDAALEREIGGAQKKLAAVLGPAAPRWYWPPFLEADDRVRAAASRAGLAVYAPPHLVVSMDYDRSVPAAEIFRRATTGVEDGTVILFHEWRAETRAQLPAILAELRKQGGRFLTFSALHAALASVPAAETPAAPPAARATPAAATAPATPATSVPSDAAKAAVAPAATASTSLPPGGEALLRGDPAAFRLTAGQAADAVKFSVVTVTGAPFARALHLETARDLSPAWAVEVRAPLTRAVRRGDTALVRFFARAPASADETGAGQVRVVVQQASPDYAKSLESNVTMRAAWQEFLLPFTFADDYAAGAAEIAFGFGFKRETVELGGIEVVCWGKRLERAALPRTRFSYAGREPDAAWRQQALARIEQIRKSAFEIEVRTADGQPAQGATVRVEQQRSAFQFGSALQLARLVRDTPENKIYREKALELFNAASPENDLKWPAWDGEWQGAYDRQQSLQALRWLREHGLHVRGHVLVWPGWKNLPESIRRLRGTAAQAEIPARVLQHIGDITAATRAYVQEWDVLNEPYDNRDLMNLFGPDIMVAWFKAAAAGAPGVPLYLNDYANHDLVADRAHALEFFRVAKFLQAKGAPLGGLGVQGHISAQPNPPENILAALDAYAQLKLPVRITEFDVDTEDEELQADYTRDFLILAYSHPAVVGVQHWGFWAKAHWRPRSALFRADWSEKPAALVYRDLVLHQWRTRLQGAVGAKGRVAGDGFHGDYRVTVEKDGRRTEQTFSLRPEEPKTLVTVTLK